MITLDIVNFEPDREAMQSPSLVDTVHATERARDIVTGEYTSERGNSITIERMMPRTFTLTVQVDIWTSNMDQKLQLLEQIDTLIYPSFAIQNSDSALDWTALSLATLESQNFSSLSIPIGTENEIDVATITLKLPVYLSPPARVTRQNLIQQIITNVNEGEKDDKGVLLSTTELTRVVTTPGGHCVRAERGVLTLLGPTGQTVDEQGSVYAWDDLFALYGTVLRQGETQIRLRSTLSEDTSEDVIGVLFETDEPNQLVWQPDIDTLPSNTINSVTGVINPLHNVPGEGAVPPATEGQRYLLLEDLAGPSQVWGNISASAGSIIQYQSGAWVVSFNAMGHEQIEYVTNRNTGRQFVWSVDQQSWVMALDMVYGPGYWRLGTI